MQYDYIIIGSGFGGSVSALRLSEKGYKVLIVEKGKWYADNNFAKTNWNLSKWLWIPFFRFFGIMKISFFRHITILSGVGVGGGSLVYGNTLPIPKPAFFTSGSWKNLCNWESELKPHYETALHMLGATTNPKLFDADQALKTVAQKMGIAEHFEPTRVSVFFGKANEQVKDPYFNGEGPDRRGCSYCGACMTGCRNNSKNSLDKNYLYLAQKKGAEVLAENEVFNVRSLGKSDGSAGYEVIVRSSTHFLKKRKKFTAKGIIFSGGVLGTVKLLLNLKKTTLPALSDRLGLDIRTNNETLISVSTLDKDKNLSKGVAIGSILHTDANSHLEICRYGEGSGFWKLLHLPYASGNNSVLRMIHIAGKLIRSPKAYFKVYFTNKWAKSTVVLLFMQTLDSTLQFRKSILGGIRSKLSSGKKPSPYIPESIKLTEQYSEAIHGKATSVVFETLGGIPSTAHILGGAVMGANSSEGVIDKDNRVFNYQNMYIIDGSMISANPGVNPSLTITALAERALSKIPDKE
ncbi:MAG: GMC family oxidoreductase [Flavobacteriaceae bacterium]|nr:GMC family oxidoreductase [Flavobacteriaceae bacterium]